MSETEYHVGDWVRFYRDARMFIAVVDYIHKRFGWIYLQTDWGEVRSDDVLERRASHPPPTPEDR